MSRKLTCLPTLSLLPTDKQTYTTVFVYSKLDKHVLTTNKTLLVSHSSDSQAICPGIKWFDSSLSSHKLVIKDNLLKSPATETPDWGKPYGSKQEDLRIKLT